MKKLLSLPANEVHCFHETENVSHNEWFCTSDPAGHRLGSGGGTAWLLDACRLSEEDVLPLKNWLPKEKRILLHAGGQSRRLPAYAPTGKLLRSEEHTSELQSPDHLVCRLLLEKK